MLFRRGAEPQKGAHWRAPVDVCVCSSPAFERRQNRAPGSPEVRVGRRREVAGAETPREGAEKEALAKLDSLPPPPRKAWKNGAPSVRPACVPACQSEDGDFFFIHPRPPSPSSFPQTSQSLCQCAASIGASQSSGILRQRDGRDSGRSASLRPEKRRVHLSK